MANFLAPAKEDRNTTNATRMAPGSNSCFRDRSICEILPLKMVDSCQFVVCKTWDLVMHCGEGVMSYEYIQIQIHIVIAHIIAYPGRTSISPVLFEELIH